MKKTPVIMAVGGLIVLSLAGYAWKQGTLSFAQQPGAAKADAAKPPASGPAAPGGGAAGGGPPRAGGPGGPAAVEVAKAEAAKVQDDAQAVGSLRSRQSVMLRPEVSGRIARIGFADGQRVRKGQLLLQLDDTLQRAEQKQAEAQLAIAQANYNRNRELVAQNFVAQRALDESSANLQVAQAQVQLARARVARMRVLAPFDATAGIKNVSVGDYVKDGADIVNLEDISAVYSDFRLPERYLGRLQRGQRVDVTADALPGRSYSAVIDAIDPQVDANGRSVLVRSRIDNVKLELRPGMFVRSRAVFSERADAVLVPEEALVPQGNKQFVIRVVNGKAGADGKPEQTSQRVEVKTGLRRAGKVEIVEGIAANDVVVTAGQQRVQRDGQPLRVLELGLPAQPQGAAGAPAGKSPLGDGSVAPAKGVSAPSAQG
jgi:membrane fusion protein (multidrug efflux system)